MSGFYAGIFRWSPEPRGKYPKGLPLRDGAGPVLIIGLLMLSGLAWGGTAGAQQAEDFMLVCGREEDAAKIWYVDLKESLSAEKSVVIGKLALKDENDNVITSAPLGLATDGRNTFWVSFENNTVRKYNRFGRIQKINRTGWYQKLSHRPDGLTCQNISGRQKSLSYCSSETGLVYKTDFQETILTKALFDPAGLAWDSGNFKFWTCSSNSKKVSYPDFSVNRPLSGIDVIPTDKLEKVILYVSSTDGIIGRYYVILPGQSGYLYCGWPSWSEAKPTIAETYEYARKKGPLVMADQSLLHFSVFYALSHIRAYDQFLEEYRNAYKIKFSRAYLSFNTQDLPDSLRGGKLVLRVGEKNFENAPNYNIRIYSGSFGETLDAVDWDACKNIVGVIPDTELVPQTTIEIGLDNKLVNRQGRTQFRLAIDQEEDGEKLPDPGWLDKDTSAIQAADFKSHGSCLVLFHKEFTAPIDRPEGIAVGINPYGIKDLCSEPAVSAAGTLPGSAGNIKIRCKMALKSTNTVLEICDIYSNPVKSFDISGITPRKTEELWHEYEVEWDGRTDRGVSLECLPPGSLHLKTGDPVPDGLYILKIKMQGTAGNNLYDSQDSLLYISDVGFSLNLDAGKAVFQYMVRSKDYMLPEFVRVYMNIYDSRSRLIKRHLIAQEVPVNRSQTVTWVFSAYETGNYYYTIYGEDDCDNQTGLQAGLINIPEHKIEEVEKGLPKMKTGWEYEGPLVRINK